MASDIVQDDDQKPNPNADYLADLAPFASLHTLAARIVAIWPEHHAYLAARFHDFDTAFEARMDEVARLALIDIGGRLDLYVSDYRWMCEAFIAEEFNFRRNKTYRLKTFAEAEREVYARPEVMERYVRGILISQLVWEPHARAFDMFRNAFLGAAQAGSDYLEIGPGHGLFVYFAAHCRAIASIEAWDVSQSSIAETRNALARLGVTRDVRIELCDVVQAPPRHEAFDLAVISEVLEHLEQPDLALRSLHAALRPGGRIFVNAPVNSPAPDHIYLWQSPDEFVSFFEQQGFDVEYARFFPVTGASLGTALRKRLSISCVLLGRKRDADLTEI